MTLSSNAIRKLCTLFMLLCVALSPISLMAEEASLPSSDVGLIGRTILGLLFVIFFIFFIFWLMKRSGFSSQGSSSLMRVVASLPLGMKEKAVLIQVGDNYILIGVAQGNIRHLETLSPESVASLTEGQNSEYAHLGAEDSVVSQFAQKFAQVLNKNKVE